MPSVATPIVIPLHGDFTEEGRHFQAATADQARLGLGLELGVDLLDTLLKQRTHELLPDRQERIPKVLLPLQDPRTLGLQEGLEELLDLLLQCRL